MITENEFTAENTTSVGDGAEKKDSVTDDTKVDTNQPANLINTDKPVPDIKADSDKDLGKDIYLSQGNEQNGDGKQENKANLYINRGDTLKEGGIVLNVHQINTKDERKKSLFSELEKKDYVTSLNSGTRSYLEYVSHKYYKKFSEDRIILVNNMSGQEIQSMAIIELLMKYSDSDNVDFFSHYPTESVFRVQQILYDFHDKGKVKDGTHFLILNNGSADFIRSYNPIESVLKQSAEQNSAIRMLKGCNSYLIILTKHIEWYGNSVKSDFAVPVINLSAIHEQVWAYSLPNNSFETLIANVEFALTDCGWLSEYTNEQKSKALADYITAGNLEYTVDEHIRKSTNEELNAIMNLIKEPINKVALFNGAYFLGSSIDEQNAIVSVILEQSYLGDEGRVITNAWKNSADDIMTACGLTVIEDEYNVESYRFVNDVRRDNLLPLYQKKYKFFLQSNCDIIVKHFLYNHKLLSGSFINGLCELIFQSRSDNALYLKQECLKIVDILEAEERKEEELRILFARLVFIIEKWQKNEKNNCYLPQLYELLLKTAFKRNIFGAVLTYICNDTYPDNLNYLEMLLEGSDKDADLVIQKVVRTVCSYFQNGYDLFFRKIIKWNKIGNHERNITKPFLQVYTAIALHIYDNRFESAGDNKLDYIIVKNCIDKDAVPFLPALSLFLFPPNGLAILDKISRQKFEKQNIKSFAIDKMLISLLYYLWAVIIVRIAFLCRKINATYDLGKILVSFIETIEEHNYEIKKIELGLLETMHQFHIRISEESYKEKPNNQIRIICKESILIAKEVKGIINKKQSNLYE